MHYYQFNIGDFTKDSAHLTLEEEAIYRRLIDLYYRTEKPVPLEIQEVSRAIRARGYEDTIDLILNEFFTKTEKSFKQKRIELELKKYKSKSKKAQASAQARWNKPLKESTVDANALRTDCEGTAKQETLNTNHKTLNNKKEEKKTRTQFKKPTSVEVYDYFREKGFQVGDSLKESQAFHDYYESNGWKVGRNKMVAWKNAASGWIKRSKDYAKDTKRNEPTELDFDSTGWSKNIEQ